MRNFGEGRERAFFRVKTFSSRSFVLSGRHSPESFFPHDSPEISLKIPFMLNIFWFSLIQRKVTKIVFGWLFGPSKGQPENAPASPKQKPAHMSIRHMTSLRAHSSESSSDPKEAEADGAKANGEVKKMK